MADHPLIKRYLEAGMAFTEMTQARAEAIVADLVAAGEVQTKAAQDLVAQIIDRSRANTDKMFEQVRNEVDDQIRALGLATQSDIERLEAKIDALTKQQKATKRKAAAKKRSAKKAAAAKARKTS